MKKQKNPEKGAIGTQAIYDARALGAPRMFVLGVQHMFAMFGATVLVPTLTGLSVSVTLLFAGLGTLLFHLLAKGKVPAFLGSSFAFLGGYSAIAPMLENPDMPGVFNIPNTEMLPYACFGVACAGLVYLVLAAAFKAFGVRRVMRFFPPIVTGPIIISIGLSLSSSAVNNCQASWPVALVAIAVVIVCNIWGRGMVKIIPILLGVIVSYAVGAAAGQVDFTAVREAPWIGFPVVWSETVFSIFDGSVDAGLLLTAAITIVPISLATVVEHIGDMCAISSTCERNYIEDPGLHRTLLGDGLATSLAALFGAPANTTYGENTGVLALSKVYDPRVIRLAAVYAIILSFSPKFDALVNSIPSAIVGGVSFILYGMISAVGVRNIVENQVDLTKSRNLIIAAVMFVSGLGFSSVGGVTFTVGGAAVTLSGLAIAALCGVILNAILPGNDYEFGISVDGDKSADLGSY